MLNARPWIKDDESLSSYVYRLAFANGHKSGEVYLRVVGLTRSNLNNNEFDEKALLKLALITGLSAEELQKHSAAHFENRCGTNSIQKRHVKYCPLCLKEDHYHRADWCFDWLSVCIKHSIMLNEKCKTCGCYTTMKAVMFGNCLRCGNGLNIENEIMLSSDSVILKSQKFMVEKLNNHFIDEIGNLSVIDYLKLARASFSLLHGLPSFVRETKGEISVFTNRKQREKDLTKTTQAFSNAYWAFQDFPYRFYAVLELFCKKTHTKRYEQKVRFEEILTDPIFIKIKTAYNKYWTKQYEKSSVRVDEQASVEDYVVRTRRIKCRIKISPKLAAQIFRDERWAISREVAANMLGIRRSTLTSLIEAGLLEIKTSYTKKGSLDRREITSLLKKCAGEYVTDISGLMSMHDAINKYSICRLTLAELLRFTLDGQLLCFHNTNNIKMVDFYYDPDDLVRCIEILKRKKEEKEGYGFIVTKSLLGISSPSLRELVRLKIIVPHRITNQTNGQKLYYFDKPLIDNFLCDYCTVKVASNKFGVSEKRIRKLAYDFKVSSVGQGICRPFFVKTSELAQYYEKNINT